QRIEPAERPATAQHAGAEGGEAHSRQGHALQEIPLGDLPRREGAAAIGDEGFAIVFPKAHRFLLYCRFLVGFALSSVRGRQSFIEPRVRPRTRWRCTSRMKMKEGMIAALPSAVMKPHSV